MLLVAFILVAVPLIVSRLGLSAPVQDIIAGTWSDTFTDSTGIGQLYNTSVTDDGAINISVDVSSSTRESSYPWTSDSDWAAGSFTNTSFSGGDIGLYWQTSQFGNWTYRTPINVNNTMAAASLTDYQVLVNLTNAAGANNYFNLSRASGNGEDIRFTWLNTSSGFEENVSYWIENWNENGNGNATLWVKMPYMAANSNRTLFMYYGNSTPVNSTSNATTTLVWFDDFEGAEGTQLPAYNYAGYGCVTPDPVHWYVTKERQKKGSGAARSGLQSSYDGEGECGYDI